MTIHPIDLQADVHRRYNPLTAEWVLVSPHRTKRPWHGLKETVAAAATSIHDATCYLCPGNTRADGTVNPPYESTFVFDNDFPALLPQAKSGRIDIEHLIIARRESGTCRVICYSPHHNLSFGQMTVGHIGRVVATWASEFRLLGALPDIQAVTIFENRGALMGASSPHPHGQIWANETIPNVLATETAAQLQHRERRGTCLLCDYVALEIDQGERVVCTNDQFVVVVPFWATWPFETLVLPRTHYTCLDEVDEAGREGFARILKDLTLRYDALFNVLFPYTMGLHQRPTDGRDQSQWHFHAHFFPPLLRSATVRKFMVGYEMLAGPQRDITAEQAAAMLRGVGARAEF